MMDYYFTQSASTESVLSILFGVCLFTLVIAALFLLAEYILLGISLYKTAVCQKCSRPWRSWIPFARNYLFGLIGDRIRQKQNHSSARRIIFLVLAILRTLLLLSSIILIVQCAVTFWGDLFYYPFYLGWDEEYISYIFFSIFPQLSIIFVLLTLYAAVSVCNFVLTMVNYHTLYRESAPKSAVSFLVLAIIGSFLRLTFLPPILLLVSLRNSLPPNNQNNKQTS